MDYHAYGRVNYEPILRWPRNPQDPVQPGLASAWEFNEDGSAITLYMRKGIKWSDGAPFTVDDMIFWWEYVELDPELSINPHAEYLVNDKPMTLVKIDDYTITMQFDGPNGLILRMLAFHGNQWPLNFERFGCFVPKHYLEQFHPRLNSEVTDYTLFNEKADDYNPERPTLTPWPVTEWGASATRLVAKRNPYYWKVDTEGNQLPYIDEVRLDLVEDNEVINLKAMQGEIDMQTRGMDIKKFSLFKENEAANDFRTFLWQPGAGSHLVFFFNQSYTSDPVLQEIFQNAEFRKAMSYAIDRDTINEVGYLAWPRRGPSWWWRGLRTTRTISRPSTPSTTRPRPRDPDGWATGRRRWRVPRWQATADPRRDPGDRLCAGHHPDRLRELAGHRSAGGLPTMERSLY